MAQLAMGIDHSHLINALVADNTDEIIAVAHELLEQVQSPDVLLGRIGMIAVHGDSDGHPSITLAAAAMLARLLHTIPPTIDGHSTLAQRALPLVVQALRQAVPAVQVGYKKEPHYPQPLFPSGLQEGETVHQKMHDAVYGHDALLTERLLFGLYGSGADYRSMEVRTYDSISATFQQAGHPLLFAVRGFQLLDAVEWGDRAPNILHWLAPHLPLRANADEPSWIQTVRSFIADPAHSVATVRTRLATAQDENALPLRALITSNADTTQVCQQVYDALVPGGASPRAVASVIALAATDIIQSVDDSDRELFVRVAHGLLWASAVHQVFRRVQDVEMLTLLFTSAAFVNALYKDTIEETRKNGQKVSRTVTATLRSGGFIAVSQLETLETQLKAQDFTDALATAQRYLKLAYDPRALFATIARISALTDARDDQGHTLQITQAATEEFLSWPASLASIGAEGFLRVALRAAAFGQHDAVIAQLL